jgi:hypothetical protein
VTRLFALVLLALAACAGEQPTFDQVGGRLPPPPANTARIFVYRAFEPYQSLDWVPVFFNGATVGAVGPGKVILRDVAPGTYTIEAKSEGLWPEQAKTVTVQAGDVIYAKITSFKTLDPTPGQPAEVVTYVVVLMDPASARREIGPLWYEGRKSDAARALGLTTSPERSRVEDQFGWERRGQALRGGPSVHILRSYLMSAG